MEKEITIKRIGGYLNRVIPIMDKSGKVINYTLKPLMVEFRARDALQVIVGASVLAIPVAFTEEAWVLGEKLPLPNILFLTVLSIVFISFFVYFNFYRYKFKGHSFDFIKRVVATYILSFLIVSLILTIIQKCPWGANNILAVKRVIIVSFPASMSATVSDLLK